MSTAKKIFIVLAVVVVLALGWEVYCVLSDNKAKADDTPGDQNNTDTDIDDYDAYIKSLGLQEKKTIFTPSALAKDTSLFPIKYGSKGDNVRYIQRLYNEYAPLHGAATIADDGIYGDKTDKALSIAYNAFRAVGIDKAYINKNIMTPTSDGHFTISQKQYTGYEYFMKVILHK